MLSLVIVAGALGALVLDARKVTGTPEEVGRTYLAAWAAENLAGMRALVAAPPADFDERHRRLTADLQITSLTLTPGRVVRHGATTADLPFQGIRQISELGQWPFSGVLHLAVRDGGWKVVWTPETLQPGAGADRLSLARIQVPGTELLTRQGRPLPHDSGAQAYFTELVTRIDALDEDPPAGWAVQAVAPTGAVRRLLVFREATERRYRTTLDWWTQAAAARALDGAGRRAALVAVRPSTGEVLAVADRLPGRGAFERSRPPGTAFRLVTAAALLRGGLTADSPVACPASYVPPGGTSISGGGDDDRGTVSLREAFAASCPAGFARLAAERLDGAALRRQAAGFGFGGPLNSGLGGRCGEVAEPDGPGELAAMAIGQRGTRASALCMALAAATVRDGTWRPPRLMSERAVRLLEQPRRIPGPRALPGPVAAGLRSMMAGAVADQALAGAGLPAGTAGVASRVPGGSGAGDDAWFAGYRGDLAFAILVEGGGDGAAVAAPIAARFLAAL
ncbi:hypothetical protein Sru01_33950 [Sphaerisporangium rufum]|uniref:Penicillin-binding protein n=1 Tax=Sphaerisporangium rufum TaxID=1381558 RepID=A0A919R3J6_9ACTN|nr:penicillin-binding transpeptidase domain-containing protein [Sphaerisporangium rufum]GII78413.1 hypothetical protein Sru01_33950 [Sphaerisporangium rufum]